MEVGISSATFYPLETERAVDELIRLGFRKIELFLNSEYEFSPEYCRKLRKTLDAAGVSVLSVHSYTAAMESLLFFSAYSRRTDDGLIQYSRYFAAAEILGAKYFTFHGDRSFPNKEISFDHHCEVLSRLADAASAHGVLLTQENVSWCVSNAPSYLLALRRNLGDAIGFTLGLKQARRANVSWQDYAEAMGNRLVNLHVSDGLGEKTSLLPGCGEFDYHQYYRFLMNSGYSGDALIEVYREDFGDYSEISRAKDYLDTVFGKNS